MSITPMDLDSSLDDLIKKRRTNKPNNNQKQHNQGKKQHQTKSRPSVNVQNKAKVTKPHRNSGINARLVKYFKTRVLKSNNNIIFFNSPLLHHQKLLFLDHFSPQNTNHRSNNNNSNHVKLILLKLSSQRLLHQVLFKVELVLPAESIKRVLV